MVKFTAVVRRGLRYLLDRGLDRQVEQFIANCTAPHLRRSQRLRKDEIDALRTTVAWIRENAWNPGAGATPEVAEDPPKAPAAAHP